MREKIEKRTDFILRIIIMQKFNIKNKFGKGTADRMKMRVNWSKRVHVTLICLRVVCSITNDSYEF